MRCSLTVLPTTATKRQRRTTAPGACGPSREGRPGLQPPRQWSNYYVQTKYKISFSSYKIHLKIYFINVCTYYVLL